MATTYNDLKSFRTEKGKARAERDRIGDSIARRWDLLQARETRGVLIRDAFGDVLRSWKPYRQVHDVLRGRLNGDAIATIGSIYASTRPTWGKRALFSGVSMLLGALVGKEQKSTGTLVKTATTMVGNLLRKRQARKEQQ